MTTCNESWISISVFGPSAEIERFRQLCIDLPPDSDPQSATGAWDGYDVWIGLETENPDGVHRGSRGTYFHASNYREDAPEPGSWFFAFDFSGDFPEQHFEEIAAHFPLLCFDCDSIGSLDESMGFGWFNVPLGGEPFRQGLPVPDNFWTGGGGEKRTPDAQVRHEALIDALIEAAKQVDRSIYHQIADRS